MKIELTKSEATTLVRWLKEYADIQECSAHSISGDTYTTQKDRNTARWWKCEATRMRKFANNKLGVLV